MLIILKRICFVVRPYIFEEYKSSYFSPSHWKILASSHCLFSGPFDLYRDWMFSWFIKIIKNSSIFTPSSSSARMHKDQEDWLNCKINKPETDIINLWFYYCLAASGEMCSGKSYHDRVDDLDFFRNQQFKMQCKFRNQSQG